MDAAGSLLWPYFYMSVACVKEWPQLGRSQGTFSDIVITGKMKRGRGRELEAGAKNI